MGNPVFKSVDSGATWKNLSSVAGGFQPFVYVLPKALGSFKAGTVLFAYNDPSANATHIRLSASSDEGFVKRQKQSWRAKSLPVITQSAR